MNVTPFQLFDPNSCKTFTRFKEVENVVRLNLLLNFYMSLDGGKSKRDCGDEATQFSRRKSENAGGSKRKVFFLILRGLLVFVMSLVRVGL